MGSLARTLNTRLLPHYFFGPGSSLSVSHFFFFRFISLFLYLQKCHYSMRLQRIIFRLSVCVHVFESNEIDEDLLLYIYWTTVCRSHPFVERSIYFLNRTHHAMPCHTFEWQCVSIYKLEEKKRWVNTELLVFFFSLISEPYGRSQSRPMQSTLHAYYIHVVRHKPQN